MIIEDAGSEDWAAVWPFRRKIVSAGETRTRDRDTSEDEARALAGHVLERARRDGCTGMVFGSAVETNPAVGLWTSLGLRVLGTVPASFDHPEHGPVGPRVMYREP